MIQAVYNKMSTRRKRMSKYNALWDYVQKNGEI